MEAAPRGPLRAAADTPQEGCPTTADDLDSPGGEGAVPVHINDLLKSAAEKGASDLHLKVGSYPVVRVDGRLLPMTEHSRLMQEDTIALAFSIMSARQKQKFKECFEIDMAYSVPGLGRFRVNCFQQRGTVGLVLRVIPVRIATVRELTLPPVLEQVAAEPRGLVLVTGSTGSGKSTTLAAMIDQVNSSRCEHIMTIEDPIEFLHRDKKSLVNQREVEVDTKSFAEALRSALRQDPDVILVGEMRDYETIETALLAAETGHLVLSTLHTLDATETINRIISVFPPHQQKQIRLQLASVFKACVSMRLVSRADGRGRAPAVEVLRSTPYIRECIENKDKTKMIRDAIAQGTSEYGMQTFDQSLYQLWAQKVITREEALIRATNRDELRLRMEGIESTRDASQSEMERAMSGTAAPAGQETIAPAGSRGRSGGPGSFDDFEF
jgi:twitching motility protein PilT